MESEIRSITFDSRKVTHGDMFVAVQGTQVDGHDYIHDAVERGATAIVCKYAPTVPEGIALIIVENPAETLGIIALNWYDNPTGKLDLIGVTGTNGKTTTATLLHDVFTRLGYKSGLFSTVENRIGDSVHEAMLTTPDPITLHSMLSEMVKEGCTHCFMEVSSHSIVQHRISGLDFKGAIFTNISHDHLDYHGSFESYIKVKKQLFDQLSSSAFALVNADDKRGRIMIQNTKAHKVTFGLKNISDYKARVLSNTFEGLELNIGGSEVWFKMIGDFNAYNILSVYGASIELGMGQDEVLTVLSEVKPAPGRFEQIKSDSKIIGIVDYAHTPDALNNVLKTIQAIRTGNEKVITVVGCGGDRDKDKRPVMASVACKMSDKVIFTSDNPRSENPESIIEEMKSGVSPMDYKKTITMVNREEAIKTACMLAADSDIVLVAGKGHETYQEIKGKRYPFDDKLVLRKMIELTE
jgi:UDP-N-acetylmuramoyl-L-alanyl-D-glutamate--2,6-diaminopimelate ligase